MRHLSGTAKIALVSVVFIVCTIVLYHNHDYIFKQSATLRPLELAPDASTQTPSAAKSSTTGKAKVVPKQARQEVKLNGTYEVVANSETVWQLPPGKPIGVWFVAHGCSHGAIDFWPKGKGCPDCIGLPEEVNITRELLSRGYAVLAVSSFDREGSRCWISIPWRPGISDNKDRGPDIHGVAEVLNQWLPAQGLQSLPLYAFGASSGGEFVLQLAMGAYKLTGVVSQIMAINPSDFKQYMTAVKAGQAKPGQQAPAASLQPLPPTLFIHMLRDKYTAETVKGCVATLKEVGVPSAEIPLHPTPLTPQTLHTAAPDEFTQKQSEAVYKALKAQGFLDAKDHLSANPRASAWREALMQAEVPGVADMRYCGHEIVSRTTTDMLNWFESQ